MEANKVFVLTCALTLAACGGSIRFMSPDGELMSEMPDTAAIEAGSDPDTGVEPDDDDVFVIPADDAASADDAEVDANPDTSAEDAMVTADADSGPDAAPDVRSAPDASLPDAADGGSATADTGVRSDVNALDATAAEAGPGCRASTECADGLSDTRDWCDNGVCRHDRCDDNNACTENVATDTGCVYPALPNGTACRPGAPTFTCMSGVCPSCGGENEACCEWPGSTQVCRGSARCRTTAAGLRRCITCGGAGERCCNTADGIMWASQRCNTGLSCSSLPGVAGLCR